jgi:hypothetical protein
MVRQILGDGDLNLAFRRNFGMKETEGWEELLDKIEGVVLIVTKNVECPVFLVPETSFQGWERGNIFIPVV